MIEKFENRTLTGNLKCTCKFENEPDRVWETTREEVVRHIKYIVGRYEKEGYVLTLRQLHYQLVTNNWIINHTSAYARLGDILDDCKHAGIIDWDSIEDRGRIPHLLYHAADVEAALNDTLEQYRVDRQREQMNIVELWTEKDALSGILSRSTEKYHCNLVVNKGYTSSSAIYRAYRRCVIALRGGKKFTILYFGDHDPSGLDMIRDIRERLVFMLTKGRYKFGSILVKDFFNVIPIGLSMEQIKKYNLPPNPTKLTDSRAKKYIQKFGKICWEVDALSPKVLTEIVEKNIQEQIDIDAYEYTMRQEDRDKDRLRQIIENL